MEITEKQLKDMGFQKIKGTKNPVVYDWLGENDNRFYVGLDRVGYWRIYRYLS